MLTAVPYLDGMIFEHFGKTETFALCRVEEGEIRDFCTRSTEGQGHAALADLLIGWGVQAVICGGCGDRMIALLQNAGIRVYPGNTGDVREALRKLARGTLRADFSAVGHCSCHDHTEH
ncbi:MAG: NifB/NifX family molybdenum-iron cluster-binding protein [Clostridia bacterium]|nr:NifB/NifX family molybdenum-iron cluster-binding protein [Clostridia bacterium]